MILSEATISGQWIVDSVKFGANKTFVLSLPFTPYHSLSLPEAAIRRPQNLKKIY